MTTEELVSIQKNKYKANIYGELADPLLLWSIALSPWFSSEPLKWIRSAFKKGSKVMRRYRPLADISAQAYEADLVAS